MAKKDNLNFFYCSVFDYTGGTPFRNTPFSQHFFEEFSLYYMDPKLWMACCFKAFWHETQSVQRTAYGGLPTHLDQRFSKYEISTWYLYRKTITGRQSILEWITYN